MKTIGRRAMDDAFVEGIAKYLESPSVDEEMVAAVKKSNFVFGIPN